MRRFLVYVHAGRDSALQALESVLNLMGERHVQAVLIDTQFDEICAEDGTPVPPGLDELLRGDGVEVRDVAHATSGVELVIVLGGDGTILRALEAVRSDDVPVHGVNLGHVGFLAESEAPDLATTIDRLLDGEYLIEERSTLDVTVRDTEDRVVAEHWALNEASLEKADRQKMIYVVLEIDGRPVSSFGCDGILLSTATGSTAYAFSAGGPIVWPEVDSFLVVPLAAHALFARPLMLGRSSEAAVEMGLDNRDEAILTLDGRRTETVLAGMRVEARLSPRSVRLARLSPTPFADRLVEKFQLPVVGWRGRDGRSV